MTVQLNAHTLHAASAAAMQQALQAKGIAWDGQAPHLLTTVNGQQVELIFLDTWPQEINAETGEVISYIPGYHANAVSRGEPFDFGDLEIAVSNPQVRWAGVGGEDVE